MSKCERCGQWGREWTLVGIWHVVLCETCVRMIDAYVHASAEFGRWQRADDVVKVHGAMLQGGRSSDIAALEALRYLHLTEADLRAMVLRRIAKEFKFHPDGSQLKGPRELSAEELVDMRGKGKAKSKKTK